MTASWAFDLPQVTCGLHYVEFMKRALVPLPAWTTTALQGLAFWIGYKRALYSEYPLSEGALVTELRSLIYANLAENQVLACEVTYAKLVGKSKDRPTIIGGSVRADMVVGRLEPSRTDASKTVRKAEVVMEFKRARAPAAQITKDMQRLAAVVQMKPTIRAFLLVLSEADRNDRFVTSDGASIKGEHKILESSGRFRVRRTLKAAPAYNNKDSANYASIVEVYANEA